MLVANKDAELWDLSFAKWADAKSVKVLPKGTQIEISATVKHPLGGMYYLTEYSFKQGIMNGINVSDMSEPEPTPPAPPSDTPPPVVVPEPTPEPDTELEQRVSTLERLVKAITDFLLSVFKNFKQ
jgi:hypothetical protein